MKLDIPASNIARLTIDLYLLVALGYSAVNEKGESYDYTVAEVADPNPPHDRIQHKLRLSFSASMTLKELVCHTTGYAWHLGNECGKLEASAGRDKNIPIALADRELDPLTMTSLGFAPTGPSEYKMSFADISVDLRDIPTKVTNPQPTLFQLMEHLYQKGLKDGANQKAQEIRTALFPSACKLLTELSV